MLHDVDSAEAFQYKLLDYSIYSGTIPFECGIIAGVIATFWPCSFVSNIPGIGDSLFLIMYFKGAVPSLSIMLDLAPVPH
jgi:hypothetical protein